MAVRHAGIWQPPPGSRVDTQHALGQGCVGCWIASATGHGGYWEDISGQRNHGTLTGMDPATDWVEGRDGWGLDFDGSNDYVTIGVPVIPAGEFSIRALVLPGNTGVMDAVSQWASLQKGRLEFGVPISNQKLALYLSGGLVIAATTTLGSGAWRDIAVTRDSGNTVRLYTDGSSVASPITSSTAVHQTTTRIGTYTSGAYWYGCIASVEIYNRALPDKHIERLYAEPACHIWVPGRRSTWWFSAAAAASSIPLPILTSSRRRSA